MFLKLEKLQKSNISILKVRQVDFIPTDGSNWFSDDKAKSTFSKVSMFNDW